MSEAELLAKARAGDPGAFTELCRPHLRQAFNLALRLCGEADIATDLCQAALCRAFSSSRRLRSAATIRPWLLRFVHDACEEVLRRHGAGSAETVSSMGSGDTAGDGGPRALPPDASLLAALGRLEPQLRAVVVLHDVLALPAGEAALISKLSPDAFRVRLGRARTELAELLRDAGVMHGGKEGAGQP